MQNVSDKTKSESIESVKSAIHKLEIALSQMRSSGKNTSLVEKRLFAVKAALNALLCIWYGESFAFTFEEAANSRKIVTNILESVEKASKKFSEASPQKTLAHRRKVAFELAIEAMDSLLQ